MSLNQNPVGLLGGQAFRVLLARAHAGARLLVRHDCDRGVHARVVGTLTGDFIADVPPAASGGEVQQVGLPIAAGVQHILVVEQRRD